MAGQMKKKCQEQKLSTIDKLFCKDINLAFGEDLQLAVRAAIFILVCSMPFLTPRDFCPLCYEVVRTKFYNSAAVTYFVFTLYKTTGDTIYFACGGLMGTVIAVINIWLLMGFFPGGYQPTQAGSDFVFYAANAWGAAYVFFMLLLNLDGNTKVFGLTTFVWYWMAFLNYNVPTGFAQNFQVKLNGRAASELIVACAGCSIAIVASMFPYPLLATKKMDQTGMSLVSKLQGTWADFVQYYTSDERNSYSQNILAGSLSDLVDSAGALSPYITSSWYECFGLGKWQEKRMMMKVLDSYLAGCFNRLSCTLSACIHEDFSDLHDKMMGKVEKQMKSVIAKTGELLDLCLSQILNCGWNKASIAESNDLIAQLEQAVLELTTEFIKTAKSMNVYKVSDDIAGENLVASNICCWAGNSIKFCRNLQDEMPEETGSWRDGYGLFGAFAPDKVLDPFNLNYVKRGWISVMVAFYIGYNGVAGKMIKNYNAALASTICVLLTKSLGGALTNNLRRLQGVVLGTVIGQVAYALLAWCVWWGYISVTLFVFSWSLIALYMYYHSDNYSTVGLLLCVFGNASLLQGCSDSVFDPTVAYYGIINTVTGITVMGLFDMILAPGRSSDLAVEKFETAIEPLKTMTDAIFDSDVTSLAPRHGEIRGRIDLAQMLGNEAALEPRYWRCEWPGATFSAGISCLSSLRFNLATIDYALVSSEGDPRNKEPHFIKVCEMPEFKQVRTLLLQRLDFLSKSFFKALTTEVIVDVFDDDHKPDTDLMSTEHADKLTAAFEAWAVAVSENGEIIGRAHGMTSMEEDPIADMCILYSCLQNIIAELTSVQEALAAR